MDYNRNYGYYTRCYPKPELEIGTRLEVVVTGKSWDNYVIRTTQHGADYFGMIYLGRWVPEPQPAYSSRGSEVLPQNFMGNYLNGSHSNLMFNKLLRDGVMKEEMFEVKFPRQNDLLEALPQQQQQQRFGELRNGREIQPTTIHHGAPQLQPQMSSAAISASLLLHKKNKRKAYVPREVPSSSAASSMFSIGQLSDPDRLSAYRCEEMAQFGSSISEIGNSDDFTKLLMRYFLRDEKGLPLNNGSDAKPPSEQMTFEQFLRLENAKKFLAFQKHFHPKRKEYPVAPSDASSGLLNGYEIRQRTVVQEDPAVLDKKSSLAQEESFPPRLERADGLATPQLGSLRSNKETTAAGTANFLNVTPLNIASEDLGRQSEEKNFTAPANIVNSTEPVTSTVSLDVATAPNPHPCDAVPGHAPVLVDSPPPLLEKNVDKTETLSPSGAEQLATLLGCENLAAEARKAAAESVSTTQSKPEEHVCTTESSGLPSSSDVLKGQVAEETSSTAEVGGLTETGKENSDDSRKSSPSDTRKIVVKISLGNYPHSTMETKPSPAASTSSTSTRRSVADLRCPPEIAKSFEEQQIVRRSDTGCPPMMPRRNQVFDDGEGEVNERAVNIKRKTRTSVKKKAENLDDKDSTVKNKKTENSGDKDVVTRKKKIENPVDKVVVEERKTHEPVRNPIAPVDKPKAEENIFNLVTGDIVWAKNGSEPFWPGELFQFTRVNGVAGAVITWYGVDTFTPFIPLPRIEPFTVKYSQRFNPKRNDKKYQKGVARAIYQCRPRTGYFETNMTKYIHEILVSNYNFVLEPFEATKKRKRKSGGSSLKRRKLALSFNSGQSENQSDEPANSHEDEDRYDDDESASVEGSNGVPEGDVDGEQNVASLEQNLSEPSSSTVSPHKSEDSTRTSPRSPNL